MKKSSTLSLFIAFIFMLYISFGQVAGLFAGIYEAKEQASGKGETETSTLIIPVVEIASGKVAITGKKEVLYNGKLYDIFSQEKQGDKIIFKVYHDEKEEGLLSSLKEVVESWMHVPSKNTKHNSAKSLTQMQDYIPTGNLYLSFSDQMNRLLPLSGNTPALAVHMAVLKSPPKFV